MPPVNVAVVDVGSNTARLLVAAVDGHDLVKVRRERHYLRLGDDVHALGRIGPAKLAETATVARRLARLARKAGAEQLETIVTAPGRQAVNGSELVAVLERATDAPVAQLAGEDEGRLAWEGAVARPGRPANVVTVIDVGGGSCEVAVGARGVGPEWVRSIDTGALLITRAYLARGRPTARQIATAREAIRRLVGSFDPPPAEAVLVVGGTARAIRRVIGSPFGWDQLEGLAQTLERVPPGSIASSHGVTLERVQTLLGGTLVLAELAYRLDAMLHVADGGVREGAALVLARGLRAAA